MGFDIECIIDIQTYPGEYFCPVCRTLVYPTEALQSQCSHLYCKPCLAHIAYGTKACPYDGYLVTDSDSKPLMDSDKMLGEKIGQVKVHCLFFRSGCKWEGILSDITSHCSECSFGSSPVLCNRCGVLVCHNQVEGHAQICTDAYEAQVAMGSVPWTTSLGRVSSAAAHSQLNQLPPQPVGQPPAQHPQVPQFHQPPLQMRHYHASQAHVQPQIHPQPQFHNQSSNLSNLEMQPLAPQNHNQFPQAHPPQSNLPTVPAVPPQLPHLPASSFSGHHAYQQHQPAQQMQSGPSQQNQIHQHPASGSFQPVKVHGQVLQQPAVMRPPLSPGSLPPQQLSTFLAPQGNVPDIPPLHQQFSAHAPPPTHPPQHGTVMHPFQQTVPQQFAQQQPFLPLVRGQLQQLSHFPLQPLQLPLRPHAPSQSQQSQNYVGRPIMSDQGMHPQIYSQPSVGFGAATHAGPAQAGSSLKQVEDHQIRKKTEVMGSSSTEFHSIPHSSVSRLKAQVSEHPPQIQRPQESGILPHLGQSIPLPVPSTNLGMAPCYIGPPRGNFESLSAPQRPLLTTLADMQGIMGKTPQICHEGQSGPQNVVRPSEASTSKYQRSGSSHMSGSGETIRLRQTCGNEAAFWRNNAETALDSKFYSQEQLNPILMEPTQPLDQASRSLDEAPIRSSYEAGMKLNIGALDQHSRFLPPQHASTGHGFGDVHGPGHQFRQSQMKRFSSRSPGGEYLGISPPPGFGELSGFPGGTSGFKDIDTREAHRFAEGSRSFNLPSDPNQNSFHNSSFPPMSSHLRRGGIDAPKNLRFGEHTPCNELHNSVRTDDAFGQQGPSPFTKGELSGSGYLPGHFKSEAARLGNFPCQSHIGELGGPGKLSHHLAFGESIRGDRQSIPIFGEAGIRSSYSLNAGNSIGEEECFDQSRKRKSISMGWCRICNFDCDTVERLEMHSQTREHQKMAMDMVESIKQRNNKKQRTFAAHIAHERGSSSRNVATDYLWNKP